VVAAAEAPQPAAVPALIEPVDLRLAETVEAADVVAVAPVGRGKHAKRVSTPAVAAPTEVEALADQMLAELAVSEAKNPLGPLAPHLDSPGKRVGVMIGGAVAGICLLFIVMTIVGAVFT
jgi:hypothetical protein